MIEALLLDIIMRKGRLKLSDGKTQITIVRRTNWSIGADDFGVVSWMMPILVLQIL